jgi:hypothetical protein
LAPQSGSTFAADVPIRGDVSQISPPIRILLVCVVGFLGAYMLFLRPKEETIPPVEPAPNTQTSEPAVSEPGKVAEAAQEAVDATNGKLSEQESVDGVDAGETAATTKTDSETTPKSPEATASAAGVDLNGIPKPVAKAIRQHKVLVLLFWNGKSADDKAVHAALANVNRWHGRVAVQSVSIKKISKYGRVARGVDVEQSPTVVVADTELRAEALVGYVDARTIDQAVVDAFRNSDGLFTDAYLKQVDAVCVQNSNRVAAIPNFYSQGDAKKVDARLTTFDREIQGFIADFNAIKAPKKWRSFKAATAKDYAQGELAVAAFASAVTPKSSGQQMLAAQTRYRTDTKAISNRADKRFDAQGLFRCGSQF